MMRIHFCFSLILLIIVASCKQENKTKPISDNSKKTPEVLSDKSKWVELSSAAFILDMKYATVDNFVDTAIYPCQRCFVRPQVADALHKVSNTLKEQGYRIKFFDCYRPLAVQWEFWNKVPDTTYVADPRKGSMHNRGLAVDITLVNETGNELDMGTGFDYFDVEAHPDYPDHSDLVKANRLLLRSSMEAEGFEIYPTEWWHFALNIPETPIEEVVWDCK